MKKLVLFVVILSCLCGCGSSTPKKSVSMKTPEGQNLTISIETKNGFDIVVDSTTSFYIMKDDDFIAFGDLLPAWIFEDGCRSAVDLIDKGTVKGNDYCFVLSSEDDYQYVVKINSANILVLITADDRKTIEDIISAISFK